MSPVGIYPNRVSLLRDAIVIGLRSKEVYYKRIEKGSELTLEELREIAQNQDTTTHEVGYMRPEFKGGPLQIEVHKLQGNRQSGAKWPWNRQQPHRQGSNGQPHRTGFTDQKQVKSKKESFFNSGAKPSHPKSECPAKKAKCFKRGKEGHYGSVCRSKRETARVNELHSSLQQLPSAWTAYWMNTSQFTSTRLFITSSQ